MAFTEEKRKELEQNAELRTALETADSPEKVHEILTQYNVDVTLDEVREMTQEAAGELSLDDLDNVAGGVRMPTTRYRVIRVPYFPYVKLFPINSIIF